MLVYKLVSIGLVASSDLDFRPDLVVNKPIKPKHDAILSTKQYQSILVEDPSSELPTSYRSKN